MTTLADFERLFGGDVKRRRGRGSQASNLGLHI